MPKMFFLPSTVQLCNLKINSVGKACSVSIGSTEKTNRAISKKKSQGFGETSGDLCDIFIPISFVNDKDFLDSAGFKTNINQ
jgi:hypothetical protein